MYRAYIVTSEKVYDESEFKRCCPFVRFFYFFFSDFFPLFFLDFRITLFFLVDKRSISVPLFLLSFANFIRKDRISSGTVPRGS